jgi:hypothetical protein
MYVLLGYGYGVCVVLSGRNCYVGCCGLCVAVVGILTAANCRYQVYCIGI